MTGVPVCREGHHEVPCSWCWAADAADRCVAGRLAYGHTACDGCGCAYCEGGVS